MIEPTTTTETNGRLGNQIIRNVCVSYIARKNDIYVKYSSFLKINGRIGIPLFVHGKNTYPTEILLTDDNFFSYLFPDDPRALSPHNINANASYFQTKEITSFLYSRFFRNAEVMKSVQSKNPFLQGTRGTRPITTMHQIFIHVRLTDASEMNPGFAYYRKALSQCLRAIQEEEEEEKEGDEKKCVFYVATDDYAHPLIRRISALLLSLLRQKRQEVHVNHLGNLDDAQTMQLGSTCKYLVLSHGSFSAITGYMAYSSKAVFYPADKYASKRWCGDMFSGIPGWTCIV